MERKRKKELLEEYKKQRPPMGVFAYHCINTDIYYIGISTNIPGTLNSLTFRLKMGSLRDKKIQKDWDSYGKEAFDIRILDELDYDKDESKTDYCHELEILRDMIAQTIENKEYI